MTDELRPMPAEPLVESVLTQEGASGPGPTGGSSPHPAHRSLLFPVIGAAISGGLIATQSIINADVGVISGVWAATWLSFLGTLLTVILCLAVTRRLGETRQTVTERGSWWWWIIGLCGIPLVVGMALGTPLIGVAIASVCAVAGQTVTGLGFDARGVGRANRLPLTGRRIIAGAIALLGLLIAVFGHSAVAHGANAVLIGIFIFVAGAILCIQQAGTGYIAGIAGNPLVPALGTSTGGTAVMTIVMIVIWANSPGGVTFPGLNQWYLYLGGPIGAGITIIAAWAVQRLGVFLLTLAVVGGQMLSALILDWVRLGQVPWTTIVSAVVSCAAVVLAMPRRAVIDQEVAE